jgi:ferric-dicitrate binding protein FerR (iron transport regulator)
MDQQQARDLLTKYRLGRCTEEEKAAIAHWYARTARERPDLPENLDPEALREHSWRNILAAVREEHTFEARLRPMRTIYVAAAVAAMLCIGFFWLNGSFRQSDAESAAHMVTASTLPGEVKTYRLPDSSLVTLNGGSSLRFPGKFGDGAREIVLVDGEAYFAVQHDAAHPFIVNAGRTRTQVLGTVFSVRAYQGLHDVRVTVASGKVGVRNASGYPEMQTTFLLPDEQLVIDNRNGGVHKEHVQARALAGWVRGTLDFSNEDLRTIALLLEKKFNVPVRVEGKSLEEQRLTARFRAEETLDDILGTLAIASGFSYRHAAGQVLISMNEH